MSSPRNSLFDILVYIYNCRLKNVGTINPYLNFFNRPEDRAAIWRPLPQQDLDVIDLSEKAEIIITEVLILKINLYILK